LRTSIIRNERVERRSIVILYRVEPDTILITNIFSGGRDYETLMRDHR
jgi:toxin ParE1/3/4